MQKKIEKNPTPFHNKNTQLGIDGNALSLTKTVCEKPTANIILTGESLKAFLLRSKER